MTRLTMAAILVFIASVVFSAPVEAKKRHKHRPVIMHSLATSNPSWSNSLVSRMEQDIGRNPTGWARVWCGQYLGMVARALGMKPPAGFPLATAWARFGAPASPAPGVVAVMRGHVGVVRQVLGNGKVEIISGNHGHKVGIGVYSMSRVIAWRTPG